MASHPRPKVGFGRERQSKAAKRQSDKRNLVIQAEKKSVIKQLDALRKQLGRSFKGTAAELRALAQGIPKVVSGEKTFRQVKRRSERIGFKVQTGRIRRGRKK